ncbi:DUF2721 domain-containing protein [Salinispirillum marinum]|uniref:DUF2721 domain-containing protein n=2 Tax=Saccharospirillaceae TaxID=255527 RepID=A0ABV8BH59_9GAMM
MEFSLTTPALLFPAISLLMLAYTNRFIVISQLIRNLYQQHQQTPSRFMRLQIEHLRTRVRLIRAMQAWGAVAFIACTLSMLLNLLELGTWPLYLFGGSLVALLVSLIISLVEIIISGYAIRIQLQGLDRPRGEVKGFDNET